jgi:Holliday junction resolvase
VSHYAKGTRFEHKVRNDLIENGYLVMRAAGSKGGTKADLVAFKPGQQLLIQCKTDGRITSGEWDTLVTVAGWVGAVPILAVNGERGRGVSYIRLLTFKQRTRQRTDSVPFLLDEVIAA